MKKFLALALLIAMCFNCASAEGYAEGEVSNAGEEMYEEPLEQQADGGGITPSSPMESIEFLQDILSSIGLLDEAGINGNYDASTAEAVYIFQQIMNDEAGGDVLALTGQCDAVTLSCLQSVYDAGMDFTLEKQAYTGTPVEEPDSGQEDAAADGSTGDGGASSDYSAEYDDVYAGYGNEELLDVWNVHTPFGSISFDPIIGVKQDPRAQQIDGVYIGRYAVMLFDDGEACTSENLLRKLAEMAYDTGGIDDGGIDWDATLMGVPHTVSMIDSLLHYWEGPYSSYDEYKTWDEIYFIGIVTNDGKNGEFLIHVHCETEGSEYAEMFLLGCGGYEQDDDAQEYSESVGVDIYSEEYRTGVYEQSGDPGYYYGRMYVANCDSWISLRESPDVDSRRIAKLPLGTELEVYAYDEKWGSCWYGEEFGFVRMEYLSDTPPSPAENRQTEAPIPDLSDSEAHAVQGQYPSQQPGGVRFTLSGQGISGQLELASGSYQIAWSAAGDVQSYFVYLFDEAGILAQCYENTAMTSIALNTDDMNPGEVYELRVGALPRDGAQGDIAWQSLRLKMPGEKTASAQEQSSAPVAERQTTSGNAPYVFREPGFEEAVREALGKPAGDIYASDLSGITSLQLYAWNSSDGASLGVEGGEGRPCDLGALSALPHLEKLELILPERDVSGIEFPEGLTNLTELSLYGSEIGTTQMSDLEALRGLTNLKVLRINFVTIGDLSALSALTNLSELDLSDARYSDIGPLRNLKNLTRLNLSSWLSANPVGDLSPLSGLTNLTELNLCGVGVSDIEALSGLTSLTSLDLGYNNIRDIGALRGMTELTELELWENNISSIDALRDMRDLKVLLINGNRIEKIDALSGLTNLTELDLYANRVSEIEALRGLTNLTKLDLGGNRIRDISALGGLTNLTELNLEDNSISDWTPVENLKAEIDR